MSWNSTFIILHRDFSNQIDKLQTDLGIILDKPLQTISWEKATSSSTAGKSIGVGDGWTIVCDRSMFLDSIAFESHEPDRMWLPTIERGLEFCSTGSKAFGFIMSGVSGTYGMTIYDDGKLSRCRLIQEGETIINIGSPSKEEIEIFQKESDEERRVFLLLDKFGLSLNNLENIKFTLYESPASE